MQGAKHCHGAAILLTAAVMASTDSTDINGDHEDSQQDYTLTTETAMDTENGRRLSHLRRSEISFTPTPSPSSSLKRPAPPATDSLGEGTRNPSPTSNGMPSAANVDPWVRSMLTDIKQIQLTVDPLVI